MWSLWMEPMAFFYVFIRTASGLQALRRFAVNRSGLGVYHWQGGICRGGREDIPGHWISRYGTKWLILCWCATATQSRPPRWVYLQIPPWSLVSVVENPVNSLMVPVSTSGTDSHWVSTQCSRPTWNVHIVYSDNSRS